MFGGMRCELAQSCFMQDNDFGFKTKNDINLPLKYFLSEWNPAFKRMPNLPHT